MDMKTLKHTPPWEWPKDVGKIFLGILRDERAAESDRLLAAELAGDYTAINDELADVLLSIVHSGEETEVVRAKAVISLGPALEQAHTFEFEDPDDILISEETFRRIQESLHKVYMDAGVPKEVRRRILEASVRAPRDWHREAVRAAYSSDDEDWKLTAVFCMRFVRGFDDRILEALESKNQDIHYQAVCAAGNWSVDAAWSHVAGIIRAEDTDKSLLLAAMEAVVGIRPEEAPEIIGDLINSEDEDIADAAYEAIGMAEGLSEEEDYDNDEFIH